MSASIPQIIRVNGKNVTSNVQTPEQQMELLSFVLIAANNITSNNSDFPSVKYGLRQNSDSKITLVFVVQH